MNARYRDWKVIASSMAGSSHIAQGIPCQDTCDFRNPVDGILIAAVADGAGSAKYAQQGSLIASKSAVQFLLAGLATGEPRNEDGCRSLLKECVHQVRANLKNAVYATAIERGGEAALGDFATTLIAYFVSDSFLGVVQIGDGAMVYRKNYDALAVACRPEQGEYLNETCFITSEDFEKHCRYAIISSEDVDGTALFSDGVQMLALLYNDHSPHIPFFKPLFDFVCQEDAGVEDLRRFLASDRVCERTDDDKTLLLAVRMPTGGEC